MSVNSSSSSNASLAPPPLSSSVTLFSVMLRCNKSSTGVFSVTTFTIVIILIFVPLLIQIMYLGFQRRRQQRSGATMSHADIFTYNMVVTELLNVVGFTCNCWGVHTDFSEMMWLGVILSFINFSVQQFFHLLTCAEHYLAVVHPVTYLSLKSAKGIRIRSITIGFLWLLCFACTGFLFVENQTFVTILCFCMLAGILIGISFCSVSALCVLIRPVPGEGGGARQRVDQSKLRAFYILIAIQGVLFFRFGGNAVCTALYGLPQMGQAEKCIVWFALGWFSLPSSLVLPLLFLHRAGKLPCCRNNNESE